MEATQNKEYALAEAVKDSLCTYLQNHPKSTLKNEAIRIWTNPLGEIQVETTDGVTELDQVKPSIWIGMYEAFTSLIIQRENTAQAA